MIHRVWHGWTEPGNADAYEDLLRTEVLPGIQARGVPGYHGAWLMRRDAEGEVAFVTTLRFESLDAVRAFAGADHEVSYVPDAARALLARWDARATHYEVVLEPEGDGRALAEAVGATVTGPMWHGPALREAVEGLTAEQAAEHPIEGAHSIWELVLHVGAWADIARERIVAGSAEANAEVRPERNFPPVPEVSDRAWSAAVRGMEERYEALAATVAVLDRTGLARGVGGGTTTVEVMVRGVVEHGVYHGGQIALLRRALGVEPPAS